jgi:hypothetical protein
MAVCYARAFTKSSLLTLNRTVYAPDDPQLGIVHDGLIQLRNKV